MTGSALRPNVAERLGISTAQLTYERAYQPGSEELARIRGFVEGCEVAWIVCTTSADALDLGGRMKQEWVPPLTKL
jgi:hypothetical protein